MAKIDVGVAASYGYRLRGGPLVEQAEALKVLTMADMPRFKQEKLLDETVFVDMDEAIAAVLKGLQGRSAASAEAHLQTAEQVVAMHDLKADRRRLIECVVRAFRYQPELALFNQGTYHGTTVSAFCTDLNRKLGFAREHEAALAAVGAGKEFQDQVAAKLRALEADSGAQEAAMVSLPDSNRAFCEAKGRLYFLLKDIINAARALHNRDPESAAKYTLKILYRRGSSKAKPEPVPATTPAT